MLPFEITVIRNEEKMIPMGELLPSSATAMASYPVLTNTFGIILLFSACGAYVKYKVNRWKDMKEEM